MKPTITTTPDGRTFASSPRPDGPIVAEFPVPGELGALLTESGYRARVVVERVDGGALAPDDAAFIGDAMAAAAEHGTHSPEVRERAASGHFARARARVSSRQRRKHTDAAE